MSKAFEIHREKRISEISERLRNSRIKKKEKAIIFHNMSRRKGKISTR